MRRAVVLSPLVLLAGMAQAAEETSSSARADDRRTLDATHLSKAPAVVSKVTPSYPAEALRERVTATVSLLVDIDDKGEVTGATVDSSTNPGLGFEEAALTAIYATHFSPAEIDDKPVAVQVSYSFTFRPPRVVADAGTPDAGTAETGTPEVLPESPPGPILPVGIWRGTLRERGTRTPMPGVTVWLVHEVGDAGVVDEREILSDENGRFQQGLPPGNWRARIETPGYRSYQTSETVRSNEAVDTTLFLERESSSPFDVVVTAQKPRKEVSRTVIDHTAIEKIPGSGGDPLLVVQNLTGVARVPLGSGDIIVRGSAPRDTRIFAAGMEIPSAYHFGGLRSVLPLAIVESIDFQPGNQPAFYGRGTGGVVDITLKRLSPRRTSGYVDVNLLDAGVFLETPVGQHTVVALAARRSYVDALLKAFFPSDSSIGFATAPRYYDGQLIVQSRPRPGHDLRLMIFGSDDRLAILFKQPADFDANAGGNQFGLSTSFYRSLFSYTYTPGETWNNTLRLSQGRDWLAFGIGVLSFSVDAYTSQVRDTLRVKLADWLSLSVGADLQFLRGTGTIALPPRTKEGQPPGNTDYTAIRRTSFNNLDYWSPAAFAELEVRPVPSLLIVPGLRFDYFSRTDASAVAPRLGVRQSLGKAVTVKAGAGLYHQRPDFGEDYPGFGNPKLTTEKAWHFSGGAEWRITATLSLDGTLFYKHLYDLISPTDRTTSDGTTVTPLIYDNGGRGRVRGAEVLIRKELGGAFTGWLAYTLSRSERIDSGASSYRLFDYDQTHILTVLGSYAFKWNITASGRLRYVSGNPRTPVVGSVVNASADRYEPLFGAVNSARNPAFHQLDLRVDKRWIFDRWMLNVYLDVQNVYNHKSPEGLTYSYDYARSKPTGGLPILALFGVRADL
jgi:TonB family protein